MKLDLLLLSFLLFVTMLYIPTSIIKNHNIKAKYKFSFLSAIKKFNNDLFASIRERIWNEPIMIMDILTPWGVVFFLKKWIKDKGIIYGK